jgi:hypothetical protein
MTTGMINKDPISNQTIPNISFTSSKFLNVKKLKNYLISISLPRSVRDKSAKAEHP